MTGLLSLPDFPPCARTEALDRAPGFEVRGVLGYSQPEGVAVVDCRGRIGIVAWTADTAPSALPGLVQWAKNTEDALRLCLAAESRLPPYPEAPMLSGILRSDLRRVS